MTDSIIYQREPDFVFRKIVDEAVLVPTKLNVADMDAIYTLNESGALLWGLLETPRSSEDLLAAMAEGYEADPQVLASDLQHFLAEMLAIGALRKV